MVDGDGWFKKQITMGNMMSIGALLVGFAGFYFNTSSTLTAQGEKITTIERKIDAADRRDDKQQVAVAQERSALRSEMTDRSEKTTASIADLKKDNAVIATQLVGIRDDIVRLGAQIATLPGAGGQLPRR